jgi:hypothetical protein
MRQKWRLFSQLPAVKKDIIFGTTQTTLGPSYFVALLAKTFFGKSHYCISKLKSNKKHFI